MPKHRNLLPCLYITAVLALPVYPSFLPSETFSNEVSTAAEANLQIPMKLGGWCGTDDLLTDEQKKELTSGAVVYRTYKKCDDKSASRWLEVEVLQGSAELHCLLFCLAEPKIIKSIVIPSKSGNISASLVRFRYEFKDHLALLWYQTEAGSGPVDNRWMMRFSSRLNHLLPILSSKKIRREVLILLPENKQTPEDDLSRLSEMAKLLYEIPFPT